MDNNYEMLWRPTFEAHAAFAWLGGSIASGAIVFTADLPLGPFYYMGGFALLMSIVRGSKAVVHWRTKRSLKGYELYFMEAKRFVKLTSKDMSKVWFGRGFDWKQTHAQRMYEISKRDIKELSFNEKRKEMGAPWIHGVEPNEKNIFVPNKHLEGHTIIFGTTGAGKTRAFDLLITQAVLRGEPVVIIDPKGDKDLRRTAQRACHLAGRPEAFVHFHPAFKRFSYSIDPCHNWNRATEIASRLATLIPSETGMDPFVSFSWMVLNHIANGLIMVEERPTLVNLRHYVEGGPESLLIRTLKAHFNRVHPTWTIDIELLMKRFKGERGPSNEVKALIEFYVQFVEKEHPSDAVSGLMSMYNHERDHFSKMVASLMPLLNMLTSGDLRDLLSPDMEAKEQTNPITDSMRMINENQVVYLGLDSLSDGTVGSAIGSIILADLTAVAGERYNNDKNGRVNIFIDEAAEVVNDPMIQMMNKGRGAGFQLTVATQSFPDFVARMGSEDKARKVLANANNLVSLRIKDGTTQEFVTETFGKTIVRQIMQTQNTNAISGDRDPTNWTGGYGERLIETEMDLFPADLLSSLPNLEYIASVSGGRIIKGRFPILTSDINPSPEDMHWVKSYLHD